MSVIVLDGHLKSALACVRSLGKSGVYVVCGAERSTAMACHSRYVQKSFVYHMVTKSQQKFIDTVVKEAKEVLRATGKKPVVFCFSDATQLTLARAYEQLQEYIVLPIPSLTSVEHASDKALTYELAKGLLIPTIKTYDREQFEEVVYPAVVKNRHSIVFKNGSSISGSASFVFSLDELINTYEKILNQTGEAPLVQEFVKGEEYGVEMICNKGEVIDTLFVHKRIRSLSPRGGAGVVKETAQDTPEVESMKAYAQTLAKELKWDGPIMVEFKVDEKVGRVLLMEINGRFWGSLPLAIQTGIDFPMIAYTHARGEMFDLRSRTFGHVRTRHFLGDVKWLWTVLFAHDPLRSTLYPSRLRAFYDFKKEIFISKGDVFSWNDPIPSIMEYMDILKKSL